MNTTENAGAPHWEASAAGTGSNSRVLSCCKARRATRRKRNVGRVGESGSGRPPGGSRASVGLGLFEPVWPEVGAGHRLPQRRVTWPAGKKTTRWRRRRQWRVWFVRCPSAGGSLKGQIVEGRAEQVEWCIENQLRRSFTQPWRPPRGSWAEKQTTARVKWARPWAPLRLPARSRRPPSRCPLSFFLYDAALF